MSTDCPRTRLARMPSTRTARLGQSTGRSQSARKGRGQGETGKQLNQGLLLHNQRRAQVGSREHERSHNKQKRHLPSKRRTLRTRRGLAGVAPARKAEGKGASRLKPANDQTRGHCCTTTASTSQENKTREQQQRNRKAPTALTTRLLRARQRLPACRPNQQNAQTVWHECLPRATRSLAGVPAARRMGGKGAGRLKPANNQTRGHRYKSKGEHKQGE